MELMADMVGMKCFKGRVQGSDIDTGSIYTIVKMDERYNRQDAQGVNWKFGHALEEWKMPNAASVMAMSQLKPSIKNPVSVKLTIERVSNGRETSDVLVDVVPLMGATVDHDTGEIRTIPTRSTLGSSQSSSAPARKVA